jgi:hypothetical protein
MIVIVVVQFFLPRSMDANCCSFVLFVVREEAIDVLCTRRSLLSFSSITTTIRSLFLLFYHTLLVYTRVHLAYIRLVDDVNGGGVFLPSLYTSRGKRGWGKKKNKRERETLMNNALLLLDWSALLQILSPDRHAALDKVP